ncbi:MULTISPECIES: DUF1780 domain-containing protein [Paraburkholderia]|uniref:DUF1780 domain-containing protein n=1 Tax=Paraburkholderia madseniana TaxID=2599607 RepID=A0AAP5ET14_9BURK|nr:MULTISPECIES: DUF1780 domain-containing protein [Paraburkholderia]MCX4151761.1 DUF1780 domain-containing protein [Paraburkholderia madseniana]MDN7154688.1 DUF1780 domain-containing protein [Paraburkholderia sp. WS6]MDQ6413571.1 DUF1780 domain-containing protein [Paraburkholderia madseniana]
MGDTPRVPQSDDEFLASMRESAHEELLFFSNKGKEARERWVVSQFLEHCSLAFVEDELRSPHQRSKTDVLFRDANFQVKEILNPGSKRSGEVKATYERLKAAATLKDIIGPPLLYDVPPSTTIYLLVTDCASRLATDPKYTDTKRELDLLLYITRTHASLIRQEEIRADQLELLGWRSISCLASTQATVLFAQSHAPAFLRLKNLNAGR